MNQTASSLKRAMKLTNLLQNWQTEDTSYWYKDEARAQCWRLMPVILATQEAEIRRIMVQSQPGKYFVRPKHPSKKGLVGWLKM
jgi:hypothetical protein